MSDLADSDRSGRRVDRPLTLLSGRSRAPAEWVRRRMPGVRAASYQQLVTGDAIIGEVAADSLNHRVGAGPASEGLLTGERHRG